MSDLEDGRSAMIAGELLTERIRHKDEEGWTTQHDDTHVEGELADAAACYAIGMTRFGEMVLWPWHASWWKPHDRRRDLVKAGSLIIAEIERLDRSEERS